MSFFTEKLQLIIMGFVLYLKSNSRAPRFIAFVKVPDYKSDNQCVVDLVYPQTDNHSIFFFYY